MPLLLPIVAILASSILSVNARTYIGCTTNVITGSSNPPSVTRDTTRGCDSYCTFSYPNPYFYFQQSNGLCYCSDASPDAGIYAQGVDDQGGCAVTSNYLVYATTTTFQFQGCASNMETDKAPSSVVELEDCFAACATEGSAMFYPNYNDDMFGCRCNTPNTIQGASSTTCGRDVWFTFTHSADASASGLARRSSKERLIALRRQSQTLCPKDAKACAIPGSETYECIDTSTELESCGGCMFGEYHALGNTTLGTDCSSLPGIAFGAVTCHNSRCEAFACKTGYELLSGLCVPIA